LQLTGNHLSFELDGTTKYLIKSLYLYADSTSTEYLTFQNYINNEILFYDLKTCKLSHKLQVANSGPDGVRRFIGYYIKTLNEIYLTESAMPQMAVVDGRGKIIRKIRYLETPTGTLLMPYTAQTNFYHPMVFIDNKIYITQPHNPYASKNPNDMFNNSPVCMAIDAATGSVEPLPFTMPNDIVRGEDFGVTSMGIELYFSRCFDGEQFVYSFYFKENIYVTDIAHQQIKEIPAKSKYIDKFAKMQRPSNVWLAMKRECEIPMYGNLIYDPYREVYYRVARPEASIGEDINPQELKSYQELVECGCKVFSIVILNKNFEVIGETLFPEYTYVSTCMFVHKEGLYISTSHFKNPNFNENELSFDCFQLVENK
jgi:hypothetical protein